MKNYFFEAHDTNGEYIFPDYSKDTELDDNPANCLYRLIEWLHDEGWKYNKIVSANICFFDIPDEKGIITCNDIDELCWDTVDDAGAELSGDALNGFMKISMKCLDRITDYIYDGNGYMCSDILMTLCDSDIINYDEKTDMMSYIEELNDFWCNAD